MCLDRSFLWEVWKQKKHFEHIFSWPWWGVVICTPTSLRPGLISYFLGPGSFSGRKMEKKRNCRSLCFVSLWISLTERTILFQCFFKWSICITFFFQIDTEVYAETRKARSVVWIHKAEKQSWEVVDSHDDPGWPRWCVLDDPDATHSAGIVTRFRFHRFLFGGIASLNMLP